MTMKLTLEFFKTSEILPKMGDRIIFVGRGPGDDGDWGMGAMIVDMPHKLEYITRDRNEPYCRWWTHVPVEAIKEQDPHCPAQNHEAWEKELV